MYLVSLLPKKEKFFNGSVWDSFLQLRRSFRFIFPIVPCKETISKVNVVKDLGVLIDSQLNHREHIEHICSKARKIIGFIQRTTAEFKDCYAKVHL